MSDNNCKINARFAGPLALAVFMLVTTVVQAVLHKGGVAGSSDPVELVCDEEGVVGYQKSLRAGESTDPAPACTPFFFEPVPINSASRELLMTIPGVGSKTAAKIQQEIVENGTINNPAELMRVNGIGSAKMEKILPHVSFR